ncbi:hypothetical protein Nepgr_013667 [Nepenthes gracilis]|uniref:RRM domain-containing protein n=1 Tax=Nepenthes gracilis TaxID=150966 RepID=A0AAD3SJK7_NEPGR|nr:hypothetical protein Nepgr_013667 [Nepenthes gracilis]
MAKRPREREVLELVRNNKMGDPYWRNSSGADTSSALKPGHEAHLPPESSSVAPQHVLQSNDVRGSPTDRLEKDVLTMRYGTYGIEDNLNIGAGAEPGHGALAMGMDTRSYPYTPHDPNLINQRRDVPVGISPLIPNKMVRAEPGRGALMMGMDSGRYPSPIEDPNLINQRQNVPMGISPHIPDVTYERPDSLLRVDGLHAPVDKSNILFVDGLPSDCTRREVGHIFRPFIGFKDIKVVHKEPRLSGDKAMVLCFVEFNDSTCAQAAMEALQGYKFDDKKPDSPSLRIHFAHFPFRLPSTSEEKQFGIQR